MALGWRMFTVNTGECVGVPDVARLVARSNHIELFVGDPYSLQDLGVVAFDAAGDALNPVPIDFEYTEQSPEILDLEEYKGDGGAVVPLHSGKVGFRISLRCDWRPFQPEKDAEIWAVVKARR